jgi:ssDNA-binding Zn-finger/Zn-ribbon topoisomerase 1
MGIGTKNETILRLKMPYTVQLLYAFFSLVPKDEVKTEMIETRIAQGKNPLGALPCPNCGEAVWPTLSEYGFPILICSDPTCGYTRRMDVKAATEYARLMGLVCDRCGGQAIGKKGDSGVFIGCSNYPRCRWTKRLADLI